MDDWAWEQLQPWLTTRPELPEFVAWAKSLGGISYPLLADIHRDVVKRYGIHWPELNACHRATFVIDRQGVIRFVERYGRGELPDPAKVLAEVKKLG